MSWLRRIAGVTRLQKIRNDDIRQPLGTQTTLSDKVVQRRLRQFGHVERMTIDRIPRQRRRQGRFWGLQPLNPLAIRRIFFLLILHVMHCVESTKCITCKIKKKKKQSKIKTTMDRQYQCCINTFKNYFNYKLQYTFLKSISISLDKWPKIQNAKYF